MDLQTVKTVFLIVAPFFVLTMIAVIHASQREYATLRQKVVWMLVAAIPFFGFVVYFLIGRRKARRSP